MRHALGVDVDGCSIDWESIENSIGEFALAVMYANRVAVKCEDKMSGGYSFKVAIEQAIKECKDGDYNQDIFIKAVGLLYSAWKYGDMWARYYKDRHGRDLSVAPTIDKVTSPILIEHVGRTRNKA